MRAVSADPSGEVRRNAIALDADWICMVVHGGPGIMTLFLKSEDEQILRAAPCPVVCIPEPLRRGGEAGFAGGALRPIKRILVPMDPARANDDIMSSAVALAIRFGARIDSLRVEEIHRPLASTDRGLRGVRRAPRLARKGELVTFEEIIPKRLRGRKAVRFGLPLFFAVTHAAREFQSDLIVLAAPTRRWKAHARVDFRTERILRGTSCPVVCIPEQDATAEVAVRGEIDATLLPGEVFVNGRPRGWAHVCDHRANPARWRTPFHASDVSNRERKKSYV